MKCLAAVGLLVILTSVLCEDELVEPTPVVITTKPKPIGVIYLIQLLNESSPTNNDESTNTVPSDDSYKSSKLLLPLRPKIVEQGKGNDREKRSPGGYGGGKGGCNVCGGGGGGYPGGGGGGYPGGGHGGGFGGGGGGAWAHSSSSASAGGWGGGGGKGKYGK